MFSAYDLKILVPEGYFAHQVSYHFNQHTDEARAIFELRRDRPGTLSSQEALALAREGLVAHIQTERMNDSDWLRLPLPGTWPALLADGIMATINAFGTQTGPYDVELHRLPDRYIFTGAGPYEFYTEVAVSKADGHIISAYVEID